MGWGHRPAGGSGEHVAPHGDARAPRHPVCAGCCRGASAEDPWISTYQKESRTRPLLFFVHGGAWRGGDKLTNNARNNRSGFIELSLSQGFGVASINYRLSPEVAHPAHVQDVAQAFAWVHGHGAQYGLDVDSIIVAGHSAGAHLVSLLALDSKYLLGVGLTPTAIKGVIAISGVYDIPALFGYPRLVADDIWGGAAGRAEASPARKLIGSMPDAPPFLVTFTEVNDMFGFDEQAKLFHSLLLAHDVPAQLADIPTRDSLERRL